MIVVSLEDRDLLQCFSTSMSIPEAIEGIMKGLPLSALIQRQQLSAGKDSQSLSATFCLLFYFDLATWVS